MYALQSLPEEPVISISGLAKTYNGVLALNSLDLKVPKNSIFGFPGPNGTIFFLISLFQIERIEL